MTSPIEIQNFSRVVSPNDTGHHASLGPREGRPSTDHSLRLFARFVGNPFGDCGLFLNVAYSAVKAACCNRGTGK